MKKVLLIKLRACIVCMFFGLCCNAQNSLNAGGESGTGGTSNVSYSIGQVFYENFGNSNYDINPGVQQNYIIKEFYVDVQLNAKIELYPNPVVDKLNLNFPDYNAAEYEVFLFDALGKIILEDKIKSSISEINTSNLMPGTYILQVRSKNEQIKSFQIIKN